MPSLAYATSGKFQWQDRLRFARFSRSEYYEAEMDCANGQQTLDVKVEKGLAAPYLVGATSSTTPYIYQRKQSHIKRDHADICILHYLISGSMRTSHYGIRAEVSAGQFIIFRSNSPYVLEYEPGAPGERAMFYASLPPDFVLRHFAGRSIFGRAIVPPADHRSIGGELFSLIFENGAHLAPDVANSLLSALIKDVARIPVSSDTAEPQVTTLQDYRLEKIRSYLALHFTNPDLTTAMVAEACQISPRYLSYLLASAGTSFSRIVWQLRMEKARRWLESSWLQDVTIGSFAFQAGFKSPSHFIHAFRKNFGCTPGEYRRRHIASGAAGRNEAPDDTMDLEMALSAMKRGQSPEAEPSGTEEQA